MRHLDPKIKFATWLAQQEPADLYHQLLEFLGDREYNRWMDHLSAKWDADTKEPVDA